MKIEFTLRSLRFRCARCVKYIKFTLRETINLEIQTDLAVYRGNEFRHSIYDTSNYLIKILLFQPVLAILQLNLYLNIKRT